MSRIVKILIFLFLATACSSDNQPKPAQENIPKEEEGLDFSPINDKMNVGAFYYPWYSSTTHWSEGYAGNPALGEYESKDSLVIRQHLQWAINHGIDFFMVSWFGIDSFEDETLKNHFTKASIPDYFKFGILYETPHLVALQDGLIDLDDPVVTDQIINDLKYLGNQYFDHPNFLKIDDKPVVYMYLTRLFSGDIVSGMESIRNELIAANIEVYLIGDQVYWQDPEQENEKLLMKQFDAVSSYNMHASEPDIDVGFTQKVDASFDAWKTAASANGVEFIPGILVGYDDTKVRPADNNPVIMRSPAKLEAQSKMALKHLSDKNMLLITTFNEWHESTQLEPDLFYGNIYLEAIQSTISNHK